MARYTLLGINIDLLTENEIFDKIMEISEGTKSEQVILLDTYLLMKAKFDKSLAKIINTSALVIPISKGIIRGLKFVKGINGEAHNYFNLTIRLLSRLTDFKRNIYVIGGKNEKIIRRAENNIKGSFPGIRLLGTYHIGYKKSFEKNLITAVLKTSPSLVIVSTNRPKQERWIAYHRKNFPKGVFLGVENFVTIIGGNKTSISRKKIPVLSKNVLRIFFYMCYSIMLLFSKIFFRNKNAIQNDDILQEDNQNGVGDVIFENDTPQNNDDKKETDVFGYKKNM